MEYRMTVRRRIGKMSPLEFNEQAARMTFLCANVFGDLEMELIKDIRTPAGKVRLLQRDAHTTEPSFDEPEEGNALVDGTFARMFKSSRAMTLTVRPFGDEGNLLPAFAQLQWMKSLPDILWLHAQNAHDPYASSLTETLRAEMFSEFGFRDRLLYSLRED